MITVDFTLAVDERVRRGLDINSIHSTMMETLSGLEYDRINDVGGMDYIKTEIIRELDRYVEREDFRGLYIRNIVRDDNIQIRALDAMNVARGQTAAAAAERRWQLRDFFDALGR